MCPAHAFAREGEREGARRGTRARARTEIAPSHGAQVEAQAVEREVGRVRVHHLELRRERNGGGGRQPWNLHENDRREKRVPRGSRNADRVDRDAKERFILGETKSFLSGFLSRGSVPFGKSERSRKGNSLGKGLENRTSARSRFERARRFRVFVEAHSACESGGPALRGTRAARDARDLGGRAIDGRASTQPRESRARAGAARAELATRARAPRGPTGKIPHPVKTTIFPGPEKADARGSLAYRRVERPRGVRSYLGSDVG